MEDNKVTMTTAQIIVMDDIFATITAEKIKLKGKVLYAFAKNHSRFRELVFSLQQQRAAIFRKHGEVDQETQGFVIKPENQEAFEAEIQEFAQEVHVIDMHQVPIVLMNEYELDMGLYEKMIYANFFTEDNCPVNPIVSAERRIELLHG